MIGPSFPEPGARLATAPPRTEPDQPRSSRLFREAEYPAHNTVRRQFAIDGEIDAISAIQMRPFVIHGKRKLHSEGDYLAKKTSCHLP
jgi:hypothetical protein